MQAIAQDESYNCPEPVMWIIGRAADGAPMHVEIVRQDGTVVGMLPEGLAASH
jgi:hypothetical protein